MPNDADESRLARQAALGYVADSAATMELVVRSMIGALIGGPRALVVVAGQPMKWLVDNGVAIIEHNDDIGAPSLGSPEAVAALKSTLKRCGKLTEQRNDALHGSWDDGGQLVSKWRNPHLQYRPSDIEALRRLGDDIAQATADFVEAAYAVQGIVVGRPHS